MSDLIDKLPEMLLQGAKLDAEEGEYAMEEHINYMAAHRIRDLERSLLWLSKSIRNKNEQMEEMESQLKILERSVDITTDRLIRTQNETAYGKQKAKIKELEEIVSEKSSEIDRLMKIMADENKRVIGLERELETASEPGATDRIEELESELAAYRQDGGERINAVLAEIPKALLAQKNKTITELEAKLKYHKEMEQIWRLNAEALAEIANAAEAEDD